ncbi:MAG: YihY/virulence factor BrkB family protein [Bacteroidia bacterium]|nr:YihY/virulence factor BrkB family protein [Bacteroidia bacterium]
MANVVTVFKKGWSFLTERLWVVRLDKMNKRHGFFVKQLRVFSLAIKGFNEDNCLTRATALTFYTLFSIVPVLAVVFAIAKGFGYDETLKQQIATGASEYSTVLNQAFIYADSMLENAKGGVIAGIGVLLLLWSVISLLINIENSFNDIWEIKIGRTWYRKLTDYTTIMIVAPIFLIVSGGLTVAIQTKVLDPYFFSNAAPIVLKLISFFMICLVFTFLYIVLPNTRVTFKSAFTAAVFATILFELLEWAYVSFQIGTMRMNAIYGSFAALPLFLIWIQYSWYIVLFGAELAFANQNVDHYELENEIKNISVRYKRVIALMVCNNVVKKFQTGIKPPTAFEIAQALDLPVRLARTVINELVETKLLSEVKTTNDKEIAYQPGISDSLLTIKFVINRLDEKGVNELPITDEKELAIINRLLKDLDNVMSDEKGNVLVKDIA